MHVGLHTYRQRRKKKVNRSIASFYEDSKRFCEAMNCKYNSCPAENLNYCPGVAISDVNQEDIEEFLRVLDEWLEKEYKLNG